MRWPYSQPSFERPLTGRIERAGCGRSERSDAVDLTVVAPRVGSAFPGWLGSHPTTVLESLSPLELV